MVETLLDMAREHVQLATVDLDFVDKAIQKRMLMIKYLNIYRAIESK